MNCSELEDNLIDWASTNAELENVALSEHLDSCDACTLLWIRIREDLAELAREAKLKPQDGLQAEIMKRVTEEQRMLFPATGKRTRNMMYRGTLTAAALVAGLYIGIALGSVYEQNNVSQVSELSEDNYFLAVMDYETIETNFLNAEE